LNSAGDLLSAESLLFAVLGVVFGVWYGEIVVAIGVEIPAHIEDRGDVDRTVNKALFGRALPVAFISLVVFMVFVPESVDIVWASIRHVTRSGLSDISSYDAVNVALVLVSVMTAAFSMYVTHLAFQLRNVRERIRRVQ
jgi:hypothetical protein